METNNFDKNIKEKLDSRTFTPSESAWERLSIQLDERKDKIKKSWLYYINIAATITLLIAIGTKFLFKNDTKNNSKEEFIVLPSNKKIVDNKIDSLLKNIKTTQAIVKNNNKQNASFKNVKLKVIKANNIKSNIEETKANETLSDTIDSNSIYVKTLHRNINSKIKINPEDLLYAVTHNNEEVNAYYAKNKVTRDEVLKIIKSELEKTEIKVDPETILAEVERSIDNDDFKNNFLKTLKTRVSDIASAITCRNN